MAHFVRPPGASDSGYDVDHKSAPGSVWRMQVPFGSTRRIALWGGEGLFVRSNNPGVVSNSFVPEIKSGAFRILPVSGKTLGISMVEVGKGSQVWTSLQVQVVKDYSYEQGDPSDQQCAHEPRNVHWLLFDGYYLKLHIGSAVKQVWHARSGKKTSASEFDYTPMRQKAHGIGPIPEGEYWIAANELATKPAAWEVWRDPWEESGWGNYRITIHRRPGTGTLRGGFFIHGGRQWGSAGCIDLTSGMDSFASVVRPLKDCYIPLTVDYGGISTVPDPL